MKGKKMESAAIEKVGPIQAQQLLEMNTDNFRAIDGPRVARYAKEMALGRWEMNGDTIRIKGKTLLDGQHRLHAVIESNTTQRFLVVRGLKTDGHTIDRGKPRTLAQWLAHLGVKNSASISSMSRLCVAHDEGMWGLKSFTAADITDSMILDYVKRHNDNLQAAVKLAAHAKGVAPLSPLAALLFLGTGKRDPSTVATADWFVAGLARGVELSTSDPVYHLRTRMLRAATTAHERLSPYAARWIMTLAWNKTAKGETSTAAGIRIRLTGPAVTKPPTSVIVATD